MCKYQKYNQFASWKSTMLKVCLSLIFLALLMAPVSPTYCSSNCIDYTGACFDETPQGCWVCANHIFNMVSTPVPAACSPLTQTSVLVSQLANSPAMSLAGYSSSMTTPTTCTNYTFSGMYSSTDYISKNFTGIPLNHYALVVRFSVGYIGNWTDVDVLQLNLKDASQSVNYAYRYICDVSENICGQVGYNNTDCIRIREYTMTHNTSFVTLNFTALNMSSNIAQQWWGIKELIVAAKLCHAYCQTCYGQANTNCLSCASGFYLQGNVCLPGCDNGMYMVADARLCVGVCPEGYYPFINSTDQTRSCLNCASGCLVCSSFGICQAWESEAAYVPNMWKDKLEFWILLILVAVAALFFIVYKLVRRTMPVNTELQEKLHTKSDEKRSDEKKTDKGERDGKDTRKAQDEKDLSVKQTLKSEAKLQLGNDSMMDTINHTGDVHAQSNLWFNELVELQPNEVKVSRGRRRRRSPKELSDGRSNEGIEIASNIDL